MNELFFILQVLLTGMSLLIALYLGKEALIAVISTQVLLANLFVVKQITLFGNNATASDAYAVGCMLGLNLLQEYYGKEITRRTIWISFLCAALFVVSSQLHLLYVPFVTDTTQDAFLIILRAAPRIILASLLTYIIVQQVDMRLYGFLKRICRDRWYVARNWGSIAFSQLLDTVLFSFLGLYGIVTYIGQIILISYSIKMAVMLLATPFLCIARKIKNPYA